jgi:bifunctional DNase/RNase
MRHHDTRASSCGASRFRRSATLGGLLWVFVVVAWWGWAGAADEVEVTVRRVVLDQASNAPVVVLENEAQGRALPIWVGHFEAQAIAMELEGLSGPRPLTHDLLKTVVEELEAVVDRVVIDDFRGHTYYATIHLRAGGGPVRIDSRPSDAIALALRVKRPIHVKAALLSGDGSIDLESSQSPEDVARVWGLTVQNVTRRLAECFDLSDAHGVLVSDVSPQAEATTVKRGDIITDVHGIRVQTVADLRTRAGGLDRSQPVYLGLRRQGVYLQVDLPSDGR